MPTTVYVPPELLKRVDKRAAALRVSRNRYIVEALQRRLQSESDPNGWPRGFLEQFQAAAHDPGYLAAARQLDRAIASKRKSRKKAPAL